MTDVYFHMKIILCKSSLSLSYETNMSLLYYGRVLFMVNNQFSKNLLNTDCTVSFYNVVSRFCLS